MYKMYQCVAVCAYVLLQYSRKINCFAAEQSCSIYVYNNRLFFSIHKSFFGYSLATSCCHSGWFQMLHKAICSSWYSTKSKNNPVTFRLPNCHIKHHINICAHQWCIVIPYLQIYPSTFVDPIQSVFLAQNHPWPKRETER